MEELDRANPKFEGSIPFRLCLGEREVRHCNLTLRVLDGVRVRFCGAPLSPRPFATPARPLWARAPPPSHLILTSPPPSPPRPLLNAYSPMVALQAAATAWCTLRLWTTRTPFSSTR
jgi:hypothetical protein